MTTQQASLFSAPLKTDIQNVALQDIKPGSAHEIIRSVGRIGIIQAILLKPSRDPAFAYEIVDGGRRFHSAAHFKLLSLPALVTDGTAPQLAAARALANTARSNNPVQEARAWSAVMAEGVYPDVKSLAEDLGVPVRLVKKRLRLAKLPDSLLSAVEQGSVAEGTAEKISSYDAHYQNLALRAFEQTTQDGKRFTDDCLNDIRTRKSGDTRSAAIQALGSLPSLQPLMVLKPVTILAEQIRTLAASRHIALDDLAAELGFVAMTAAPSAAQALPIRQMPPAPDDLDAHTTPLSAQEALTPWPADPVPAAAPSETPAAAPIHAAPAADFDVPLTFSAPTPEEEDWSFETTEPATPEGAAAPSDSDLPEGWNFAQQITTVQQQRAAPNPAPSVSKRLSLNVR